MYSSNRLKPRQSNHHPETRAIAASETSNVETNAVPVFNIRLVERITSEGSADFRVDAPSADAAAEIIAAAHSRSQAIGSSIVTLPDGQSQVVESEAVVTQTRSLILLADNGTELQEIMMSGDTGRAQ